MGSYSPRYSKSNDFPGCQWHRWKFTPDCNKPFPRCQLHIWNHYDNEVKICTEMSTTSANLWRNFIGMAMSTRYKICRYRWSGVNDTIEIYMTPLQTDFTSPCLILKDKSSKNISYVNIPIQLKYFKHKTLGVACISFSMTQLKPILATVEANIPRYTKPYAKRV
jgi:hypothetical protein